MTWYADSANAQFLVTTHTGTALGLASNALCLSNPNPRVGCVIASLDGTVLGEGFTQQAGGPHAEIVALVDAAARGNSVSGAVAFVTLEPCFHQGRTGPCCNALIAAGIKKVVASIADPNPLVSGQGFALLRAAGIEVEVGPGAEQSRELNIGFFSRMIRKTPWVRLKTATSLDGATALQNGASQWITGDAARADGHVWRARACAVLTGIGTVLEDDPLLNVRGIQTSRQPHLVIVDSRLETPVTARLFEVQRKVLIYTAVEDTARYGPLESNGATVVCMPVIRAHLPIKVDLPAMLRDLAVREVNELHAEAGHRLNGSLIREGLVDEVLAYIAPKLIGPGLPMASMEALTQLNSAIALTFLSATMIGPDLRVLARVAGRDKF